MTNAKDYINARTQSAEDYLPSLKTQLEEVIDKSKDEFINNGEIALTDNNLSIGLCRFRAQSQELFEQLCKWLEKFGWLLVYKTDESTNKTAYPHRPENRTYYLIPAVYHK